MISLELVIDILLSAVIFIWLWQTLGVHYFGAYFKLLEEREERTTGDIARAKEKEEDAEKVKGAIEHILLDSRAEGVLERDKTVEEAKAKAAEIVLAARKEAAEELEVARGEISKLKEKAREDLSREADTLAQVFVDRTLKGQGASGDAPLVH